MKKIKNIHFIGIGGVGMSGIALIAKAQGMNVSGSDLKHGFMIDNLKKAGIKVFIGHKSENIMAVGNKPDVVVVSTAIWGNNPELSAAQDNNIEIWHRAQALAFLGRNLKTLAVTGTHGKTSTSSMLASALDNLSQDPTFLVGGVVLPYKTNAKPGKGEYYVVEADESDKSFTYLNPYSAIITNIEADHLDHYKDLDEIYEKFDAFLKLIPKDGYAVCCGDDKMLLKLCKKSCDNVITYGQSKNVDYRVFDYKVSGLGCTFNVKFKDEDQVFECSLPKNPGIQYALNATSVIALLHTLGISIDATINALSKFQGIRRRFDLVGSAKGITIIDDYAHHPTEIAATVKSALQLDFKNVHVVWQPHRYSRFNLFNNIFHDEFSNAFNGCKSVTFTNVYGAGEVPIPGITGNSFLKIVKDNKSKDVPSAYYVDHRLDIIDHIIKIANEGDLIIVMGAGDITSVAKQIFETLQSN